MLNQEVNLILEQDVSDIKNLFGSDWHVVHRIDLWNELLRLATAPSEELSLPKSLAKVVWRVEVTSVDVEGGDVKLADGTVIQSDLVIGKTSSRLITDSCSLLTQNLTGADGVKSIVRPPVVG